MILLKTTATLYVRSFLSVANVVSYYVMHSCNQM